MKDEEIKEILHRLDRLEKNHKNLTDFVNEKMQKIQKYINYNEENIDGLYKNAELTKQMDEANIDDHNYYKYMCDKNHEQILNLYELLWQLSLINLKHSGH